jgi:hypothetical protein
VSKGKCCATTREGGCREGKRAAEEVLDEEGKGVRAEKVCRWACASNLVNVCVSAVYGAIGPTRRWQREVVERVLVEVSGDIFPGRRSLPSRVSIEPSDRWFDLREVR